MKSFASVCAGFCLLLGACSGGTDNAGDPATDPELGGSGSAASGGSSSFGSASSGGAFANGGTTTNGGAFANGGGASESAGSGALGGSATNGGSLGMGGSATGGSAGGAAGGSTNTSGSAGTGNTGGSSDTSIDYSIWVLQLPSGSGTSPTTISSSQLKSGYTSAYFYKGDDGGQVLMDPQTGITTSGSVHCRTEMRESTANGGEAAWASSGTNTMTVSGKVLKVGGGNSGTVTVGQLFNGTDSIPLIELQYSASAGGFKMLYEEAKGGGTTTNLNTPVALNMEYTFTLALTKGVATVTINGKVVHTQTPSATALAKKFYFKFGNYDQTATAGAVSTTPYTVVEAYSVDVVHQ